VLETRPRTARIFTDTSLLSIPSPPQALFDLEATNNELKSDLRDLYINSAQEVEVTSGRSAIVIHVSHQPHHPPAPRPALSCTRRIGSRPRRGTVTNLVAPRVERRRAQRSGALPNVLETACRGRVRPARVRRGASRDRAAPASRIEPETNFARSAKFNC